MIPSVIGNKNAIAPWVDATAPAIKHVIANTPGPGLYKVTLSIWGSIDFAAIGTAAYVLVDSERLVTGPDPLRTDLVFAAPAPQGGWYVSAIVEVRNLVEVRLPDFAAGSLLVTLKLDKLVEA